MRIRTLVQTGLVAAMLASGGVAVFAAPAQAERIDYCDSERPPLEAMARLTKPTVAQRAA